MRWNQTQVNLSKLIKPNDSAVRPNCLSQKEATGISKGCFSVLGAVKITPYSQIFINLMLNIRSLNTYRRN